MSLSVECIQYLEKEYNEVKTRRGDTYDRWWGLLTAEMEYIEYLIDNPHDWDDEDIYDTDLGVESGTVAEDWVEDFIYQVLDELYECDTKDKFSAKFTTTCSLAWLYFWDVKFWEEGYEAYAYLRSENEERLSWSHNDGRPLPQWMLDEMKEYEDT